MYGYRQNYNANLNLFFFKASFTGLSKGAMLGILFFGLILAVGGFILLTLLGVWAVNDIIQHGAGFWNIAALLFILVSMCSGTSNNNNNQ